MDFGSSLPKGQSPMLTSPLVCLLTGFRHFDFVALKLTLFQLELISQDFIPDIMNHNAIYLCQLSWPCLAYCIFLLVIKYFFQFKKKRKALWCRYTLRELVGYHIRWQCLFSSCMWVHGPLTFIQRLKAHKSCDLILFM